MINVVAISKEFTKLQKFFNNKEECENEIVSILENVLSDKDISPKEMFALFFVSFVMTGYGNEFYSLCKQVITNPNLENEKVLKKFEEINKEGE